MVVVSDAMVMLVVFVVLVVLLVVVVIMVVVVIIGIGVRAVIHLPKKFFQVSQIFTKQSKGN